MQWNDAVQEQLSALVPVTPGPALARKVVGFIDLTSLNKTDTEASMATLMDKAQTPLGHVAAVCVYPQFVKQAVEQLQGTPIKVATVVNFPEGESSLEDVLIEINAALEDGAEEIDVVFPYIRFLSGDRKYTHQFIAACKAACGARVILKVILEVSALVEPNMIADASYESLTAGADFIKTSTGQFSTGASLEAATVMLLVIKHLQPQLNRKMGLKVSGGIRNVEQAGQYLQLAEHILGRQGVTVDTFRIGASKLVDELLALDGVDSSE